MVGLSSVNAVTYATAPLAVLFSTMVANPKITAAALGILTSSYWLPKAEAGPVEFAACMAACLISSNAATSGGFTPATQLFCTRLCTPLLAVPIP